MALAIEVITTPRPLTHDLICDMINKINADLISVNISQLNDGVFHAKLKIKGPEFGTKIIDARPSDAISIALRLNTQIYVTEKIFKEAGVNQNDIITEEKVVKTSISIQDLEVKLREAVEEEDYEKAANLRDEIKELKS